MLYANFFFNVQFSRWWTIEAETESEEERIHWNLFLNELLLILNINEDGYWLQDNSVIPNSFQNKLYLKIFKLIVNENSSSLFFPLEWLLLATNEVLFPPLFFSNMQKNMKLLSNKLYQRNVKKLECMNTITGIKLIFALR